MGKSLLRKQLLAIFLATTMVASVVAVGAVGGVPVTQAVDSDYRPGLNSASDGDTTALSPGVMGTGHPEFDTLEVVIGPAGEEITLSWDTSGDVEWTEITVADEVGDPITFTRGDTNPHRFEWDGGQTLAPDGSEGDRSFTIPGGHSALAIEVTTSGPDGARTCTAEVQQDGQTISLSNGDFLCDTPGLSTDDGTADFIEFRGPIAVDENLEITGDATYDGAEVSIDEGFDPEHDSLAIDDAVDTTVVDEYTYDEQSGVLRIQGTATSDEYEQLLRGVLFNTSAHPPNTADRTITFSLGSNKQYNPTTGNYYEWVEAPGITWEQARTEAESRTHDGRQGYLATITSQEENDYILDKIEGSGWIGASDAAEEGVWRWVTGPEGEEDGGDGRVFFQQTSAHVAFTDPYPDPPAGVPGGGEAVDGEYHNFDPRHEPNNMFPFEGGQDHAYFCYGPPMNCPDGMWMDASNDSPNFEADGYIVEYGGLEDTEGEEELTVDLSDTRTITVATDDAPFADATTDATVGGTGEVEFDASPSTDDHGIVSFEWDFTGDGTTDATGEVVTHTFADGSHTVTLTVEDNAGETDQRTDGQTGTTELSVVVVSESVLIANAGTNHTIAEGEAVTFDATATEASEGIDTYEWDFTGDGSFDALGATPTHQFDDAGEHAVSLRVTDATGTTATTTTYVHVTDATPPIANAGTGLTVAQGDTVTLDATGSTDNVGIVSYEWDVTGNERTDLTGTQPTYTFDFAGEYEITLLVADEAGNTATDTVTVTVQDVEPPNSVIEAPETAERAADVQFDGTMSTDNVAIVGFEWDFGDGTANVTGEQAPLHRYAETGAYTVSLTVVDLDGNENTTSVEITITESDAPMISDFEATNPQNHDVTVSFTSDTSLDSILVSVVEPDETEVSLTEGDFSETESDGEYTYTATHAGTQGGIYEVTLDLAADASGEDGAAFQTVSVEVGGDVNPAFDAAVVTDANPDQLRITFDADVDVTNADGFTIDSPADLVIESFLTVDGGDTVVLELNRSVIGTDDISISYDESAGTVVSSEDGSPALSFSGEGVTNDVAPIEPAYASSAVTDENPDQLRITFDAPVDATNADGFTIDSPTDLAIIGFVAVEDDDTVVLLLDRPVTSEDAISVNYDESTGTVVSATDGSSAQSFTGESVTNGVLDPAPKLTNAVVEDDSPGELELTFDQDVSLDAVDATDGFTVTVDGQPVTVDSASATDSAVTLTLASPVESGAVVEVSYDGDSENVRNGDGVEAEAFSDSPVTNNVLQATFTIGGVDPQDGDVTEGESLDVVVTVENTGDADGTQVVELLVDDSQDGSFEVAATESVTLSSGQSNTITLTYATEEGDAPAVDVRVESEDDSSTATATVAAALSSIDVSVGESEIPDGTETAVTVTATYTNGTTETVTEDASLSSSDPSVATVAADGTVTGEGLGTADITATYEGETGSATVTVTEADVIDGGLSITIADDELPDGTETTVTVEAEFTNGSVQDVTEDATLTSTDTGVATVAIDGTVSAVGEGPVQIEASFGGESDAVSLTVTAAEVIEDGLSITITDDEIPEGTETTVTVDAEFTDGSTQDVTTEATLTSLDTSIATVASDGTVTAVGEGSVLIETTFEGETDTVSLTVTEAEVVEDGLSITIADDEIPEGTETTVTVEAEFTDASTQVVTTDATLTSVDTGVVTVDPDGTVTAVGEGTVLIEATFEGESDSVGLTVTEAVIVEDGLTVTIADDELIEGTETTVTVEAEFTDGSVQDVTQDATLLSSDTGVATVDPDGTVTAVGEGTAQIEAEYQGETETISLTVTEAEVVADGVTVTITEAELPAGTETTVTVEAEFTDGSTQDVTEEATLTSLDTNVATVANDGTVTAVSEGSVQIEATFGGESDTVGLTVTEAEVIEDGLSVTITDAEIPAGTETTATVEAEFTDGSVQDVTTEATLTSSDTGVATVASDGTVTAVGEGTVQIQAELDGEAETVGLTVTEAEIVEDGLSVTIADDELPEGTETTVTVEAEFTDGSVQDVTTDATLTSLDTGVATVASDGTVTAVGEGSVLIEASFDGETETVGLTVTDAEVVEDGLSVTITDAEIPEGTETTLTVEAEFTDGSTQIVTTDATLTSLDTGVATVANDGTVTAVSEGTVMLEASFEGESDSVGLTVTEAVIVNGGLSVSIADDELPEGTETTVTVEAEFTDGSTQDVTTDATLTSLDTGVATVASDGTVTAVGEGSVLIEASFDGEAETVGLTVTEAEIVEDGLSVAITDEEIPEGAETTVSVEAEFTDGSVQDVTTDATLTSLDTGVATVASDGTVTAVGEGTVQIQADYGGETDSVSLAVTEAEVISDGLSVSITEENIPAGTETTVTVEAEFTDGSTQDVTTDATLTSLDTGVATVASDGTVTAVSEGSVLIEASFDGEAETVGLTVTEVEVIEDGLSVTIADEEIPEGTETTVTVEAEFTDGSTQDVTTDATLTSLDTGVATVANDGTVTAVSEGSVLIEASFDGEAETVGLTVAEAEIVEDGLSVTIADDELPEGTETTVTVEAEFTDGSTQDVTTDATLTSLDTGVATVSSDGTVTAVGEGTVMLEASFEGESDSVGLTVAEAVIINDGLSVSIADDELPEGTETTVTVEAEFTDGSTQDVTTDATLTSLDTGVSTVANDGTVTAVGEGTAQIQADYNGETDFVALTVTEAEIISDGLSVTIADEEIPEGTETTVTVEAEFTDGSTQVVTTDATLTSLDTGVATVASDGTVTTAALGATQIEATFEGETDTVSLTVTEAVVVDGGLTATLAADELPAGTQTTMTVHAEFTNGSVQDVTEAATLTSLDSSVATVENDGTVLAMQMGTATIEATYTGEAATVQIEVEPAVVESLDASLADDTLVAGEQTQLTVTATYSDGSTADVTQAASLAAGETTVATIANDGLVTANAGGTTTLTATYEGETAGHTVTVLDPAFFEVELLDQPADVTEGEQLTLTAEVSNTGDVEVTQVVELLDFDGSVVDSEPLTLSPGQTATVSLDWDTNLGDAGTGTLTVRTADDAASSQAVVVKEWTSPGTGPDPGDDAAYFAVSVQDISEDVTAGTTVTVEVLVENTGDAHGTQELRLYDFDGALVSTSEPLTLGEGETATVTLTWNTATGDGGEGALTVASDDESASTPLVLITSPDGDGPPGDTGDGQSGDETTPHISGFVVSNPVDQNVRVVVVSSDPLGTIVVNVDGPESGTLTETDFTEQVRGDDFRYVGMYDGSSDGRYVVTLVSAADAAGNDGATDRSVWLTIESADGANSGVAGQNPIVFEDLTVASDGDYDIGVETTALDLDAVVFDSADQRLTFDFAAFSDTGQSFTEATGNVAIGSIHIEEITGAVDDATISFAVNKQYLEAAGTDPDALQLYRHTDGEWQPLSTFIVDETDDTYRYEAGTDGLDEFAVGVEAPVFEVEGISVSAETVSTDDVVFVDVTVRNVGSASGEYDARLLADGTVVATQTVDVPTESSRTVTFEHSFSEDGTRLLAVDSRHAVEVVVVEDSSPGPIWLLGLLGILLAGAFVFSRRRGGLTIRVDNPRGSDVRVTIESPDELEGFEVSVSGAESAALTKSDFTVSVEDDYTYTATYAGSATGTYVVSVAVGPDSGRTVSDSVVIE